MPVLLFSATLPDDLHAELLRASRECRCSPVAFAVEALESVLASRRLPQCKQAAYGARPHGTPAVKVECPEESEYAGCELSEVPLLSDLSAIEDIT